MRAFLLDRIRLVNELITANVEVEYADLVLILTAVLSSCAAQRWPGKGIDGNRFVELLIRYSHADAHCDYICVPSLVIDGLITEKETPWGAPGESTRIFRDDEIDIPLSEGQTRFPQLSMLQLKQHTYAALIYSWLRCPYAHEYSTTGNTSFMPASKRAERVSYIGRYLPSGKLVRVATFHLDYLLILTTYHAEQVAITPQIKPQNWWLKTP